MRNVFATFLVVFILLSAGGYGILWYAQASSTKRQVEAFIEKVNEKQKFLTYESIETSGFPSNVYVSLVRPRFKGRVDQLLQALDPAGKPRPSWDEDTILDGRITIGVNALSDKYSLALSGHWSQSSVIDGKTSASITQPASDITCKLELSRGIGIFDTLWNFQSLNRDSKQLAEDFRVLDCNAAGHTSTDTASKEKLTYMGVSRLYITHTPQDENSQMRFYAKITDAEITPAADERIIAVMNVFSPGYAMPLKYSAYGKQNIDIDFTYSGPRDLKAVGSNPSVDVALNKMDFTNKVYAYHTSFHVSNTPSGDTRSSLLSFKTSATFSEPYELFVQGALRSFIEQLSAAPPQNSQQTQEFFKKYRPDQAYSILYPAIPRFNSLGTAVMALDGTYRGSANMMSGDYAINMLELSATPYGIVGKGNLRMAQGALPSGSLQLSCANCLQLIDDLVAYSARVQQVMLYYNPSHHDNLAIDPAQAEAMKRFLSILAVSTKDPADKGTLAYSISSSGADINVNGRNMADIMRLYNEYIKPTLKQPTDR